MLERNTVGSNTVISRKLVAVEYIQTVKLMIILSLRVHFNLNATLKYKAVLKLALSLNTPISTQSLLAAIFSDHDIHPSAKTQWD